MTSCGVMVASIAKSLMRRLEVISGDEGIVGDARTSITIFKLLLIGGTFFDLRRSHTAS